MPEYLHASAVAFDGKAVLLTGASGSGKSELALALIALGGTLVSDDQVVAEPQDGVLMLDAPEALKGRIEARYLGILETVAQPARAALVVDLDDVETHRLPNSQTIRIAGIDLPLIRKVESAAFAAMLQVYLSQRS